MAHLTQVGRPMPVMEAMERLKLWGDSGYYGEIVPHKTYNQKGEKLYILTVDLKEPEKIHIKG